MNFSMMQSLLPLLGCLVILLNEYVLVHVRHVDTLAVFPFLSALGNRVKRCLSFLQRVKTLKVHVFQAFFWVCLKILFSDCRFIFSFEIFNTNFHVYINDLNMHEWQSYNVGIGNDWQTCMSTVMHSFIVHYEKTIYKPP